MKLYRITIKTAEYTALDASDAIACVCTYSKASPTFVAEIVAHVETVTTFGIVTIEVVEIDGRA